MSDIDYTYKALAENSRLAQSAPAGNSLAEEVKAALKQRVFDTRLMGGLRQRISAVDPRLGAQFWRLLSTPTLGDTEAHTELVMAIKALTPAPAEPVVAVERPAPTGLPTASPET